MGLPEQMAMHRCLPFLEEENVEDVEQVLKQKSQLRMTTQEGNEMTSKMVFLEERVTGR